MGVTFISFLIETSTPMKNNLKVVLHIYLKVCHQLFWRLSATFHPLFSDSALVLCVVNASDMVTVWRFFTSGSSVYTLALSDMYYLHWALITLPLSLEADVLSALEISKVTQASLEPSMPRWLFGAQRKKVFLSPFQYGAFPYIYENRIDCVLLHSHSFSVTCPFYFSYSWTLES